MWKKNNNNIFFCSNCRKIIDNFVMGYMRTKINSKNSISSKELNRHYLDLIKNK